VQSIQYSREKESLSSEGGLFLLYGRRENGGDYQKKQVGWGGR